ncbi:hypothetical protein LZU96_23455 (plasmid) [Pantoea agglomerans]|uniref:hypothetical protein n=1 Tax=Enterobacter agglomerans TaxID=549 RepID=UPI001F26C62F|nr:hypothetical protein [Pantoea agglomerans]UIL55117.1 hypothetical protein LZU96_23455 [Pantoea agglomerans]
MADFLFSPEETVLIDECIRKGHNSWKDESLKSLKSRVKEYLKVRQKHFCCYCLRDMFDEFNYVIDIEHILPKHKYVDFMFNMDNLAASCKRCNMKMKGRSVKFINPCFHNNANPFATENYKFVHPNTDVFEEHIRYVSLQEGTNILVSYSVKNNSEKGSYSIDFFKLDRLARNTNDKAQGIPVEDEDAYDGNPDDDDIEDDDEGLIIDKGHIDIEGAIDSLANLHQQK